MHKEPAPFVVFSILLLTFTTVDGYSDKYDNIEKVATQASEDNNDGRPLFGMNIRGYYTAMPQERDFKFGIPENYYEDSFRIFADAGIEFIRYLFFWESYERDPFSFTNELKTVANTADKWGIQVLYANDKYATSSWLSPNTGTGFPSILFENNPSYPYGMGGRLEDQAAKEWWTSWYNRTVTDVNGNDGWTLQAEYLKKIVNTVDSHKSTLGYEILNEPQVYSADQWEKIGSYNTFITTELRKLTSKIIVFDRQLPSDVGGPIYALPTNMAEMAPENRTNVVFKATLFGLPTHCSYAEARLNTAARTAQILGIPLWLGEFNIGITSLFPVADIDQNDVDLFISKFGEINAWGWSFWMWSFRENPPNVKNYDLVNVTEHEIRTTKYFEYLKNAVDEYGRNSSKIKANSAQLEANDSTQLNTATILKPSKDTICPLAPVMKINGTLPGIDYSKSSPYNPIAIYSKSLPAKVLIEGDAYDSESGIKMVEIRLKDTTYQRVTTDPADDWSEWSYLMQMTGSTEENELIIRVKDNADNVRHHTIFIHILKG
jgi:hypothetical protein